MGIYPIAQVAEPFSAVQYLAERVPIDAYYGIKPDPDNVNAVESGSRGGGKASAQYSDDDSDDGSGGGGGNRKKGGKKRAQGKQQKAAIASEHRWSAYELCEALAVKKSLLASKGGRPDLHRAGTK